MLKLVLAVFILIPVLAILLYVYVKVFRRVAGPIIEAPPPPPPRTRRDDLMALRAEFTRKKADLSDTREARELEAKIAELDRQIRDLDAPRASPPQ